MSLVIGTSTLTLVNSIIVYICKFLTLLYISQKSLLSTKNEKNCEILKDRITINGMCPYIVSMYPILSFQGTYIETIYGLALIMVFLPYIQAFCQFIKCRENFQNPC